MNKNKEVYEAIKRRKYQNKADHEFKEYFRINFPHQYRQAVTATNKYMEKKRIEKIINNKIFSYRLKSRKAKDKKRWGIRIVTLHDILNELGD